ncbi:cytidine deaminase [Balneolaceae bacterium ANBcel3]|nr:cytidine deaminase [Balneolaceae bacterium ANBcel3]
MKSWEELYDRNYSPYSGKKEACLVRGESGIIYPGVRVENVSFPLTIHAVQAALFMCISQGDQPESAFIPEQAYCNDTMPFWKKSCNLAFKELSQPSECEGIWFLPKQMSIEPDFKKLEEISKKALVPESSFPVAAVITSDIGMIDGVNIEVTDWQKGLCAERVAIASGISLGTRLFKKIYIIAPKSDYVSPCGACRQVLSEHMADGKAIFMENPSESHTLIVRELLPYHFSAHQLRNK